MNGNEARDEKKEALNRLGPVCLPISPEHVQLHRAMLADAGPHVRKDLVPDRDEPEFDFDVRQIEAAISSGALPTRSGQFGTRYTKVWALARDGAILSQGDESCLDLIWIATMPVTRAATPVLVIEYQDGCSLFDGSHRLARAWLDGETSHPSLIFSREAALQYRSKTR